MKLPLREEKITDKITLYNGDCLEGMRNTTDKYYDLALVDPPYGININNNMGRRKGDKASDYKKVTWDNTPPEQIYFDELFRVSKNQIVWGANHFISLMPLDSPCWLMWDKKFSDEVTFAQFELAWTSFGSTCKKFDKHPSDKDRIHPTQKPVDLYKWILHNYAKPEMKILDTHLGSMSIAIACHYFGCELTGFEIDSEYFEAGVKRVRQQIRQTVLF